MNCHIILIAFSPFFVQICSVFFLEFQMNAKHIFQSNKCKSLIKSKCVCLLMNKIDFPDMLHQLINATLFRVNRIYISNLLHNTKLADD